LHFRLQPLDLQPQLPQLTIARFALAPLPDVAAETLDVDQDLLIASRIIPHRLVSALVDTGADVVLQRVDFRAQRSDGIAQLRDCRVIGRRFSAPARAGGVRVGRSVGRLAAGASAGAR
jgi:hypothetical protein